MHVRQEKYFGEAVGTGAGESEGGRYGCGRERRRAVRVRERAKAGGTGAGESEDGRYGCGRDLR